MGRVVEVDELVALRDQWRKERKKVVFTNGCFDIIHRGHVEYLRKAKGLGDLLIVGVNTDSSVRRIKGPHRPIVPEEDRAIIVSQLTPVDYVCLFDDDTPLNIIQRIIPDILVKGADWNIGDVVGKEIVERKGGRVATIDFVPGRSTTGLIQAIVDRFKS